MILAFVLATSCRSASDTFTPTPAAVPYAEQIWVGTGWASLREPVTGEDFTSRSRAIVDPDNGESSVELSPEGADAEKSAQYVSRWFAGSSPFRDLLVSWNVDCPAGEGFCVELRVAEHADTSWSPWMYLGDWGTVPGGDRVIACDGGKIDTDYFHGEKTFERAQLRVRAFAPTTGVARALAVQNLWCCASDPRLLGPPNRLNVRSRLQDSWPYGMKWKHRLDVPFRSQRAESADIAGRICSPTSLGMVLAFHDVARPTATVAAAAYDPAHEIYGNWPRNVQAAWSLGVPGCLTRFTCWFDVEAMIASNQPVIASIAAREGELRGAPYKKTDGHLLVITGFDENGDVCVNDPAAPDAKSGQTTYAREDMQKVWLDRGGTAYVLWPKK